MTTHRPFGGKMIKTNAVRKFGLLIIALLLFAVSAWAQAVHDVTITGTVTATSGERLPGVTLTITSPALVTGERQTMTDSEGRFVFLSLPPGSYRVSAELQGFGRYLQPGIRSEEHTS